ncbi:hypothetical protein O3P69_008029 [Scylla paramamosain]|uniref:Uncharacterized protein n=1 Tax=Scylla paramamosain TaxID=85552 RepID=A0AAW0SZE0_SCYPA
MRSLLGLANQLAEFTPQIAASAEPLRLLLSPCRAFTWTPDHDLAFEKPSPEDVALGKEAYAHVRVMVAIRAATLDARSPTGDLVLDGIRTAAREDVIYTRLLELQDPVTKRWDKVGVVMGIGKSRDYLVKTTAGRVLWRNRRFIRVVPAPSTAERDSHDGQPLHPPAQKIPDPATPNARRRRRWEADGPIRRSARIALRS